MSENNTVVLGPRDSLNGTLRIEGDLYIRGTVDGEISVGGDIGVEASATVNASVEARNVTIRGTVNGPVSSRKKLLLSGSGSLNGDATVGRLVVEDGATLNGAITMTGSGSRNRGDAHHEQAQELVGTPEEAQPVG